MSTTILDEFHANNRWTPGTPYRPLSLAQYVALRAHGDPANIAAEHACDQRETQEEADGLACPELDCAAPIGTRCFGPEARCNHPRRAMAFYSARTWARAA